MSAGTGIISMFDRAARCLDYILSSTSGVISNNLSLDTVVNGYVTIDQLTMALVVECREWSPIM